MFDEKVLKKIQDGKEKWDQGPVAKTLAKNPEAKPVFTTISGTQVERLYTPLDIQGLDYDRDLGYPGMFPYTRGVQPTMYRGRYWTMRQYAGFGDAKGTNERYRYLLGQGQTGLSVAFHLPTQAGYDSDHPLSMGEVGKVGVAIDHIDDMRILLYEDSL
jgi:methylmalonyl-CoA mutase N-terminal domain/subunit